MKLTKYSQLRHGMKVRCKIEDKQIDDAKLSKNKKGKYFICQNEKDGATAKNMLGYTKSWLLTYRGIDADKWAAAVTDLESVEEEREEPVMEKGKFYVGQRVKYDGDDYITAGEYTIVELNVLGFPRIKKGSDPKYSACKHFLFPHKCHPIEEKIDKKGASYGSILRQCADIADDRGEKYGDVLNHLSDTCDIIRTNYGKDYTPQDIAEILIALKTSREKNQHLEDNLLDTINYNAILLLAKRAARGDTDTTDA